MTDPIIHLVFKTHLDIGFTDHAARVRQQYHDQFIPQAIATGEHFFAEDPEHPRFIWTTGAWLIWDHLNSQDAGKVKRLERAIERGLIVWHGLPFTTHTELMTPAIFRAGLSYALELDRRFGRQTIAAKMTDVPGHTLGMVPLMAEAGLRFLHLGVNTASPVPDVPPIFRWRAPQGQEIVVMYQGSYGATEFPSGNDIGLGFAHTNDNIGPQSVGQTVETLRHMAHDFPHANIVASTLDAVGARMWERRDAFPVITEEIGDSWIHGTASDPEKLGRFRALSRLYDDFADAMSEKRLAFGRGLAMVAEHTWGVDIKTYLRDEKAWDRPQFEVARQTDFRFRFTEESWTEQRAYLDASVNLLDDADRAAAETHLAERTPPPSVPAQAGTELQSHGWRAKINHDTGDISSLASPQGVEIVGKEGCLFGYRHESYDHQSLSGHLESYLQHRLEWAILDHDKPGLAKATTSRSAVFSPMARGVSPDRTRSMGAMPDEAQIHLGAPPTHELIFEGLGERQAQLTLVLRDKPANRMPEAGFFLATPDGAENWQVQKMGLWHGSSEVARRGGGQLQAVSAVRCNGPGARFTLELLDSALAAPAASPFMPFNPDRPDFTAGLRVNLYNNKWGTNFPMWWEGTIAFRFILTLGDYPS